VKPLLNSKAVCEILGIKAPTLSRMVHSSRIPFILLSTGRKKMTVRFREEELELWLDRRSRGALPKVSPNLKEVDKRNGSTSQPIENKEVTPFQQTGVKAQTANDATGRTGE
jgi:excisionase family DNA binding protein